MGHKKVFKLLVVIVCVSIFVINVNKKNNLALEYKTNSVNNNNVSLNLNQRIYNYMNKPVNRDSVMKQALILNNGKYENDCVFFVSEVLRRLNVDLSEEVSNTYQLMYQLDKRGYKKDINYKKLIPGDVCFTTSDNSGYPTHSFIFMKWEKKDNYDYAYVVDNQQNKYGAIYHKRNIAKSDVYNDSSKEAFAFFLRK